MPQHDVKANMQAIGAMHVADLFMPWLLAVGFFIDAATFTLNIGFLSGLIKKKSLH